MTKTTARIKQGGKNFEILVDLDKAMNFKKGIGTIEECLEVDRIFTSVKKAKTSSSKDLIKCFKTDDVNEIASQIIKNGEVQLTQEYRKKQQEMENRRIANEVSRLTIDPKTGFPHPLDRIMRAIDEGNINSKDINEIIDKLKTVIPIKRKEEEE